MSRGLIGALPRLSREETEENHEKTQPVYLMSLPSLPSHTCLAYLTPATRLAHHRWDWASHVCMEVIRKTKDRTEQQNATRWRAPFDVSLASGATLAGCHVNPVRSSFVRETEKERGNEKSFPLQGTVLKKVRLYATNRNEDVQEKIVRNGLLNFHGFTRHQTPSYPQCEILSFGCLCMYVLLVGAWKVGQIFIHIWYSRVQTILAWSENRIIEIEKYAPFQKNGSQTTRLRFARIKL